VIKVDAVQPPDLALLTSGGLYADLHYGTTTHGATMPSTVKLRIIEAKDLPIMDKASKLADAYVQVRWQSMAFSVRCQSVDRFSDYIDKVWRNAAMANASLCKKSQSPMELRVPHRGSERH